VYAKFAKHATQIGKVHLRLKSHKKGSKLV
jgi:hypothetical protein